MRRLFSTFARGWPGAGLLLMRLVGGGSLIAGGVENLLPIRSLSWLAFYSLATASGALLIAGLWTPVVGSVVAVLALWDIFGRHENVNSNLLLGTIGLALALVGPGAWSLDAWLFGWKKIDIKR